MKNKYIIYNCVATRSDKTKIIRIIKIQSHFQYEDLGLALLATSDSPGFVSGFEVLNEGSGYLIDHENLIYEGLTFDELDDKSLTVNIYYNDGTRLKYECDVVGEDITSKPITRTTPIILAAHGYSRFTHDEYLAKLNEEEALTPNMLFLKDSYYHSEDQYITWNMNDLQRFFNLYKDEYYKK